MKYNKIYPKLQERKIKGFQDIAKFENDRKSAQRYKATVDFKSNLCFKDQWKVDHSKHKLVRAIEKD